MDIGDGHAVNDDGLDGCAAAAQGLLERARMVVCIGSRDAKHFDRPTRPFPEDAVPQLWNALFVKDARSVTAVSSMTIDGTRGIWVVDGKVNPEALSRR